MKSTECLPFTQWADIHRTERFISVESLSGYRRALPEDNSDVTYLPPDASDIALGQALLKALDRSRFIWPDDEPNFFEAERFMQCYRNWQKDFMGRYGYKTKRDAYKNMNWCRAERSEGKISIAPRKSDKPGYWIYLPERTVVIPATTDAAVAGEALGLALDRCK